MHAAPPAAKCAIKAALAPVLERHPGLLLEDKGLTLALHYRQAPHLAAYAHRLMRALRRRRRRGLEMQRGKCVVEIKPAGIDKGTAVGEFMREPPFSGRRRCSSATTSTMSTASPRSTGWMASRSRSARAELRPLSPARRGCSQHAGWAKPLKGQRMNTLDLALIGNCTIGALIDARAKHRLGLLAALRRRPGVLLRCSRIPTSSASSPSSWPIATHRAGLPGEYGRFW